MRVTRQQSRDALARVLGARTDLDGWWSTADIVADFATQLGGEVDQQMRKRLRRVLSEGGHIEHNGRGRYESRWRLVDSPVVVDRSSEPDTHLRHRLMGDATRGLLWLSSTQISDFVASRQPSKVRVALDSLVEEQRWSRHGQADLYRRGGGRVYRRRSEG